jgi:proprotein convertase subtilisin/kexin type 5
VCNSKCSLCTGPLNTQCNGCNTGFYLFNNTCDDSCPANNKLWKNNALNICSSCISPCDDCSDAEGSICLSCVQGYFFDGLACVTDCVPNKYGNTVTRSKLF